MNTKCFKDCTEWEKQVPDSLSDYLTWLISYFKMKRQAWESIIGSIKPGYTEIHTDTYFSSQAES